MEGLKEDWIKSLSNPLMLFSYIKHTLFGEKLSERKFPLISFEGIDFCGKSTQAKLLAKYLKEKGIPYRQFREPGGVYISEKIRNILLDPGNKGLLDTTELLLFAAARAQIVGEEIEPSLETKLVLLDRFHDSSVAYQGFGRGMGYKFVKELQKYATKGIYPDRTYWFNVSIEEVAKRKQVLTTNANTKLDRIEVSKDNFYQKVIDGYKHIARTEPWRFKTINAKRSIDEIHNDVINDANKVLQKYNLL